MPYLQLLDSLASESYNGIQRSPFFPLGDHITLPPLSLHRDFASILSIPLARITIRLRVPPIVLFPTFNITFFVDVEMESEGGRKCERNVDEGQGERKRKGGQGRDEVDLRTAATP
jgi:hypothetical protein